MTLTNDYATMPVAVVFANHRVYKFAVNCSSSKSYVDPSLAPSLIEGSLKIRVANVEDSLFPQIASVRIRSLIGQDVDGIIGFDFLKNFVCCWDSSKNELQLFRPSALPLNWSKIKQSGTIMSKLDLESGIPRLPVSIGISSFDAVLTFSSGDFLISRLALRGKPGNSTFVVNLQFEKGVVPLSTKSTEEISAKGVGPKVDAALGLSCFVGRTVLDFPAKELYSNMSVDDAAAQILTQALGIQMQIRGGKLRATRILAALSKSSDILGWPILVIGSFPTASLLDKIHHPSTTDPFSPWDKFLPTLKNRVKLLIETPLGVQYYDLEIPERVFDAPPRDQK